MRDQKKVETCMESANVHLENASDDLRDALSMGNTLTALVLIQLVSEVAQLRIKLKNVLDAVVKDNTEVKDDQ
jgi:hypothetical protein